MEQSDHLTRTVLTSQTFDQPLPEQVITLRPSSLRAPLGQGRRACKSAKLALQHIEIVFEIKNLLTLAIAGFMPGNALTTCPYLNMAE
jgi:hypothetical protein